MPLFTIGLTKADFFCIIEMSPCCDLGNTEPQSGFLLCGNRRRAEGAASAGSVGCGHCLPVAVASFLTTEGADLSLLPHREEVMQMFNPHDVLMVIVLAINLLLEYITMHRKR